MDPQGMESQASDCLLHAGSNPEAATWESTIEAESSPGSQARVAVVPRSAAGRLHAAARRLPWKSLAVGGCMLVGMVATVRFVLPRVGVWGSGAPSDSESLPDRTISSVELKLPVLMPLRGMLTIDGDVNPCYTKQRAYNLLDMLGAIPLGASGPEECQDRCAAQSGCKYFSFDHVSMVCHLADESATLGTLPVPFISGPAVCPSSSSEAPATTKAATTSEPTTAAPTTQAPTTQAPTTKAPTTKAPTTKAPTTTAPTTKAPTTEAPTTEPPTTKPPPTLAPNVAPPTLPPVMTLPPITEASTTEAPTTTAPTTEAPTTTKAPTTVASTTKAPTTRAPALRAANTTRAPTQPPTQPPTTQSPTTQAPTTQAPTTQAPNVLPALFCFLMTMTTGYEPDLVREQVTRHAGIFQCKQNQVFSVGDIDFGNGVVATKISSDLSKKGPWGSWLNTENFLQVWDVILKEGRFWACDWTVKADPDAVFMPDRLQLHLKQTFPHGTSGAYYIKNCPKSFGLMGSLEVFSKSAVWTYGQNRAMCRSKYHPGSSGEDGYMQACMEGSGVMGKEDFSLLIDSYCGFGSCSGNTWNVAFHPYKDTQRWFECWDQVVAAR